MGTGGATALGSPEGRGIFEFRFTIFDHESIAAVSLFLVISGDHVTGLQRTIEIRSSEFENFPAGSLESTYRKQDNFSGFVFIKVILSLLAQLLRWK